MKAFGKRETKQHIGSMRMSQIITTFGPGSIVNLRDVAVMLTGIDDWKKSEKTEIHEPSLERLLHVKKFHRPSVSPDGKDMDISATRFPEMYFCPECHRLQSWRKFKHNARNQAVKCPSCGVKALPSRFLVTCVNGHIEDFPYSWWVHGDEECEYPNMRLEYSSSANGLEGIWVSCAHCHKKRNMSGCMSPEALKGYGCKGKRPWLPHTEPNKCHARPRTIQRGASNVYFPEVVSALTLPDPEGGVRERLQKDKNSKLLTKFGESVLDVIFEEDLDEGRITLEEIKRIWLRSEAEKVDAEADLYTEADLREAEYGVLCRGTAEDAQYNAEQMPVPEGFQEHLSQVVLLKRLREVSALRGFHRLYAELPRDKQDAENKADYRLQGWYGDRILPVSRSRRLGWLPAIELLGEGVFIRLNEDRLASWEAQASQHYAEMGKRATQSPMGQGLFSPRYVLLHTLSHMLIRRLALECGYSGASIRERIYSTQADCSMSMCGILLYTATPDSDGSLGGLVRMGRPENLGPLISAALQEASWCSSDPLCMESTGQGLEALNYAACHACALLPETSCEARNCLLDRCAVVGKLEDRCFGYFGDKLNR